MIGTGWAEPPWSDIIFVERPDHSCEFQNKVGRDITISDLNIMKGAIQYRRWLFNQVEAWAGQRILEVGAGIGNYTELIIDREKVVCLELHSNAVAHLKEKFSDASSFRIEGPRPSGVNPQVPFSPVS